MSYDVTVYAYTHGEYAWTELDDGTLLSGERPPGWNAVPDSELDAMAAGTADESEDVF